MLDKSVEFHSIIMKSRNDRKPVIPVLPEGFAIRNYKRGDELAWAEIQTAVGEFDTYYEALSCFTHYLEYENELMQRQFYVIDEKNGKHAATATAWFFELAGKPIGVVHALSCLPEYQSLGLGKITAAYMMDCFYRMMPGCEVWLDTQTWSYKAIGIYLDLGFIPQKSAQYNDTPNEYGAAVQVLKGKMRTDVYRRFTENAE